MFKFVAFLHIILCSNKDNYQIHGGNFKHLHRMSVSREISGTVLWVCGISSWLRTRSLTKFSSVRHFVVCRYLSLQTHPFNWYKFFYRNLIFVAANHVYKHCGDV